MTTASSAPARRRVPSACGRPRPGSVRSLLVEVDLAERAVAEAGIDVLSELGGLEGGGVSAALSGLVERVLQQVRREALAAVLRPRGDEGDEGVVVEVVDQGNAHDRVI